MKTNACAFTGHRPKSFPWKYDETAHGCVLLKETLTAQITALAGSGVTDWFCGMAQGTDLWCAQIVLDLRKKNPALKLHCVLPCKKQADGWSDSAREQYYAIWLSLLLSKTPFAISDFSEYWENVVNRYGGEREFQ